MNIIIRTIPREEMRPEVDGADWFFDSVGDLHVRVCPMSDWRYEVLLAIHEATEALMCKHNGVSQAVVDAFDQEYDKTHAADLNGGDEPAAPYKLEHTFATAIERIMAGAMKVDWKTYDDELARTYPGPSKRPEAVTCCLCSQPITTTYHLWQGKGKVCERCYGLRLCSPQQWEAAPGAGVQPEGGPRGPKAEPPVSNR